ncbi:MULTISPECIES: glycoside hydrolase family 13 protein [Streptosporangium]|uniref:Alpha-glucosidase n=1 Tax=Streptosporangium brasiliense TaxID=47480 RepID=A0ABT9RB15_9ACTN|nr:glycoside hydrolase family 13 protein [Streptosporangium brasiliense]MDP9866457.1 alpha-glucosidase [Streptosporangium brasiliense]
MTQRSVAPCAVPSPAPSAPPPSEWWRDAVIYEIYVRSFADGNGDGMGDLLGVRSRLRYLADLGVDAVWLTPFYPSPLHDGGYDVSSYRAVDPRLGTLDDARALVAEAHGLGMRVLIDIVPNHTSSEHPWFAQALRDEPGARERYVFRPGRGEDGAQPPNDWESSFGGPAWTRLPDGMWYLHLFAPEQPDLNWENPEVRAEFEDVMRFWLDIGVDGFRVDVAHGMVKAEGLPDAGFTGQLKLLGRAPLPFFDQDGVHEILRSWRRLLDSYPGERIGVAEVWPPSPARLANYVRPDELHQAFNFNYLAAEWGAGPLRQVVDASIAATDLVGAPTTWVLSNHDQVRHVTRYGGGRRGTRRARAAALLTLALPGSVYIYQGEELGLPEVLDLPDEVLQDPIFFRTAGADRGRDGSRVPIPWAGGESSFGFSPPGADPSWLPIPRDWGRQAVIPQLGDPRSFLNLYRNAVRLRRTHPALGRGTMRWLDSPPETLFFTREPGLLCTVNLGADPVVLESPGTLLLASSDMRSNGLQAVLEPDTAAWWSRTSP